MRPRSTVGKRVREKDRAERQQLKLEKRQARKLERQDKGDVADGEDPDIAGIEPGPQPLDPELFGLTPPDQPV